MNPLSSNRLGVFGTLCCLLSFLITTVWGGTTGKIAGRVLDDKKDPLPSANVVVAGTTLGAVSDLDGYYTILNVPPATYSVEFRLVGYRKVTVKNVIVNIDATTKLNATLEDETITTADVVVTAQRPIVDVGSTSTMATVSDAQIKALPVQELQDIVNLQAGVVDGHFRGGREGEVQYQVNGVSVNNIYDNASTVRIDRSLIQEVQIITGTFDAEYGQAMSGVVNTVLKSGGESFQVNGEVIGGSFLYGSGGYRGLDFTFRPAETQNYQFSISGPTGLPKTFFLVNARRYVFDDYYYGKELFLPTDNIAVDTTNPTPVGSGSGKDVALGYSREWSGLVKITNRSIPSVEISYQGLFNFIEGRDINSAFTWRYNPNGAKTQKTKSFVHGIDWSHVLSPQTYYTISLRQNSFDYTDWVYDDFYDPRYDASGPSYGYYLLYNGSSLGGVDFGRFSQRTNTYLVKASITSQTEQANQLKVGGEVQWSKMEFGTDGTLVYQIVSGGRPVLTRIVDSPPAFPGVRTYKPVSAAAYVQDMVEWHDLTVRAGVRFEYFNGRSALPSDLANPADVIPGAPASLMQATTKKYSLAPRLGLSYPVTDRSSIFFSYGHFYQLPNLKDMYGNLNFAKLAFLQSNSNGWDVMGNPDVKPQLTVQYEFGYKNAITDYLGVAVNLFYKDIRDLLGTKLVLTYNGAQYPILTNMDFGNVAGFTVSLDQRRVGLLSSTLDYTWQMAKGNSSKPEEAATLAQAGKDARPTMVPFDWDQRHTVNLTVQLSNPESYSVSFIAKFGSGEPYTPKNASDFGADPERNSALKPISFVVDMRAEKYFKIAQWDMSVFARVFNLLNSRYNNGKVFTDTGSPDYSRSPLTDRDALANPIDRYIAPRRIEVGVSLNSTL